MTPPTFEDFFYAQQEQARAAMPHNRFLVTPQLNAGMAFSEPVARRRVADFCHRRLLRGRT